MDLSALKSCFPSRSLTNIYYINPSVPFIFLFFYFFILLLFFLLCIFLLDQELSWKWLHRSCRSLNIGGFSNNLTTIINQFYLFVSLPKTLSFTHTLPSHLTHYCSGDLGTLSLGIPYHTCNATKVARETTVFFLLVFFFAKLWWAPNSRGTILGTSSGALACEARLRSTMGK